MDAGFAFRRARPEEADALRELVIRSMSHWPHPPAYLEEARRLMSLSPAEVARDETWVLARADELAGFYRLSAAEGGSAREIEELHLEPAWIGHGLGRRLFEHAVERARLAGAARLVWTTDRYALGFYLAMGGEITGTTPSGVPGDEPLTSMRLDLAGASRGS